MQGANNFEQETFVIPNSPRERRLRNLLLIRGRPTPAHHSSDCNAEVSTSFAPHSNGV
jgi:hypothetical protein